MEEREKTIGLRERVLSGGEPVRREIERSEKKRERERGEWEEREGGN